MDRLGPQPRTAPSWTSWESRVAGRDRLSRSDAERQTIGALSIVLGVLFMDSTTPDLLGPPFGAGLTSHERRGGAVHGRVPELSGVEHGEKPGDSIAPGNGSYLGLRLEPPCWLMVPVPS